MVDKSEIRNQKSEGSRKPEIRIGRPGALGKGNGAGSPSLKSGFVAAQKLGSDKTQSGQGSRKEKGCDMACHSGHSMSQWLDDSPSVCEDGGMLDRSEIRSRKSAGVAGSALKAFAGGSGGSVPATRENRVSTGSNRVSAGLTRVQTGFERVWAGLNGLIRVQSRRHRSFRLRPGRELGEKTACALAGIVFNMMYVSSALLDKGRGMVWSATIFQFFHR